MKAILTVLGQDRIGIVAAVSARLAAYHINILDMSQTILDGNFTMMMAVDLSSCAAGFKEVKDSFRELGNELGLTIQVQRTEIFDAMHSI